MKKFNYITQGVCSTNISFDLVEEKIYNLKFSGGCMGNLQAISKLVEGKEARGIANILRGNDCKGKGTSCADQLSKAIAAALAASKKVA